MITTTISFLGGGNMARSLIAGLIQNNCPPEHIMVTDTDPNKLADLAQTYAVRTQTDNPTAAQWADVIVLAVKPQVLPALCSEIKTVLQKTKPLLLSIAAGIRLRALQAWLGEELAMIRSMPNTPAMVGAGTTGLFAGVGVTAAQRATAETILGAVGITAWVEKEDLMDAVTALSGSGPAYHFLIMEAMEAAAIELGLPAEIARRLTLQTALGAARMASESAEDPATLRVRVTSPGGTTEQALKSLENSGLRNHFSAALKAARDRSIELSTLMENSKMEKK